MSLFSTMTTGERKAQAAAICREIQGLEDVEMDLGKKVSVPQDIMLEELSLDSNPASRLFKIRQQRSDKYTYENVPSDGIRSYQNNMTGLLADKGKSAVESSSAEKVSGMDRADAAGTAMAPDGKGSGVARAGASESATALAGKDSGVAQAGASETAAVPDPHSIAPGYGGPLKDVPPEKFNSTAIPKSYHSPWDRALVREPVLADTLVTCHFELEPPADLPGYKSFNRVAIPFGGFESLRPAAVWNMKAEIAVPDFPVLRGRPSFNRAAQGWGAAAPLLDVTPEATLPPESDDL